MMKFGEWPFTRASVAPLIAQHSWPQLAQVGVLNQAAHKWHRAGGNWCSCSSPVPIGREMRKLLRFKIFNQIDADGSGNLSFDELVQCVETLTKLP